MCLWYESFCMRKLTLLEVNRILISILNCRKLKFRLATTPDHFFTLQAVHPLDTSCRVMHRRELTRTNSFRRLHMGLHILP